MAYRGERDPQRKQEILRAFQRKSGGTIAQFFVSYGLGQAYESAGAKNSKAAKIAAAMTAAEALGIESEVYEALEKMLGAELRSSPLVRSNLEPSLLDVGPVSPSIASQAPPSPNQQTAEREQTGLRANGQVEHRVTLTRAGRARKITGGFLFLTGLAMLVGIFVEPPTGGWRSLGWLFMAGVSVSTVGALLFAQTMRHRGSIAWHVVSWTIIPGLFFAANAFAAYAFIIGYETAWLQTMSVVLLALGLLWVALGPFLVYSFVKEARLMGEIDSLNDRIPGTSRAEQGLTKAEILVISATTFQGITTLIAPLYGK